VWDSVSLLFAMSVGSATRRHSRTDIASGTPLRSRRSPRSAAIRVARIRCRFARSSAVAGLRSCSDAICTNINANKPIQPSVMIRKRRVFMTNHGAAFVPPLGRAFRGFPTDGFPADRLASTRFVTRFAVAVLARRFDPGVGAVLRELDDLGELPELTGDFFSTF
jgi:hypothetical protein